MLNLTYGCIKLDSIKEWLRKSERRFSAAELGAEKKKPNAVLMMEGKTDDYDPDEKEVDDEFYTIKAYLVSGHRGDCRGRGT